MKAWLKGIDDNVYALLIPRAETPEEVFEIMEAAGKMTFFPPARSPFVCKTPIIIIYIMMTRDFFDIHASRKELYRLDPKTGKPVDSPVRLFVCDIKRFGRELLKNYTITVTVSE